MKRFNYLPFIVIVLLSTFSTGCFKDLDTLPLNDRQLISEQVYATEQGYLAVLAKLYGSLILNGQDGPDRDGDLGGLDVGYSGYTRAIFYLQECSTDEVALHAGSSQGSRDFLFVNWNPSTPILQYAYYRLYMTIAYCNEFLRESTDEKLQSRGLLDQMRSKIEYYRSEARFIRAYSYSMICDLYGSGPFIDESMPVGVIPQQRSRAEIYNFAVNELEEIKDKLRLPGTNDYGRVDQVASWFLLSRIYLNSETWVGQPEYQKAYDYASMVINSGQYPLASDWRHIFLADNNTCQEIIWPLVQDGEYTINSAGTNFLMKALNNGRMSNFYVTGIGARSWGNARAKTQLVEKFSPSDQIFDIEDTWGDKKADKRAQFFTEGHTKETWRSNQPFINDFTNGYAIIKWRNVNKNREELVPGGTTYTYIDYPMFRTADAYLMAAEAILRGADDSRAVALEYVNEIRDRAYLSGSYGNNISGRISDAELTLDFILDERARELYTESVRRTDLIRFNKFTKGYNWDWKGSDGTANNFLGRDVDDKFKLFPIPDNEFTVNPNLTQNPDFR
ncbi:RagB/SusD family nutrient uptake outer membrane protein [Belliella kenyensis]|uniref:RagB/SusD family nutrient uptake outer membrane protein n=1 Tax=Belliella kenyensis TaxID=1472724 RepID=A0ABV8EKW3_9BACT|nr:RagB/SusD family nutrient uptake outer membrane protein [Belliella kenyensis]MCH7402703.1 RagB/SusD family nutrient uptake outer membrane protein [Belliella kenyensis]MDN3603749.1 RagB/SusD family nutrient uptake outer membrane protein [Belliella kenyensis]